jgi:hypothetical protein
MKAPRMSCRACAQVRRRAQRPRVDDQRVELALAQPLHQQSVPARAMSTCTAAAPVAIFSSSGVISIAPGPEPMPMRSVPCWPSAASRPLSRRSSAASTSSRARSTASRPKGVSSLRPADAVEQRLAELVLRARGCCG